MRWSVLALAIGLAGCGAPSEPLLNECGMEGFGSRSRFGMQPITTRRIACVWNNLRASAVLR